MMALIPCCRSRGDLREGKPSAPPVPPDIRDQGKTESSSSSAWSCGTEEQITFLCQVFLFS